jgi:hypothetical protein
MDSEYSCTISDTVADKTKPAKVIEGSRNYSPTESAISQLIARESNSFEGFGSSGRTVKVMLDSIECLI